MPKIVLSYRREDSDAIAGRIRDRLAARYGAASVFMDVDSIPFGVDFRAYVAETLANTDLVLAIIGPKWAGAPKRQKTRIQNPVDPVRIEIETAFKLKIPIIPVLVNGAAMPEPDRLPETLQELAYRNAAEVDAGRDFHPHVDRVIAAVDAILGHSPRPSSDTTSGRAQPAGPVAPVGLLSAAADPKPDAEEKSSGRRQHRTTVIAAICAAVVLLAGAALVHYRTPQSSSAPPAGTQSAGVAQPMPVACTEERNLRSQGTSSATSIMFRNRGEKTVRVYWISHQGNRVLYATLERTQVVDLKTYLTHPWVIANSADECRAIYLPAPHRQEIDVVI